MPEIEVFCRVCVSVLMIDRECGVVTVEIVVDGNLRIEVSIVKSRKGVRVVVAIKFDSLDDFPRMSRDEA